MRWLRTIVTEPCFCNASSTDLVVYFGGWMRCSKSSRVESGGSILWPRSVEKADLSAPQTWQEWLQPLWQHIRGAELPSDQSPSFVLSNTSP
jgi:hypothetical protein